MASWKNTPLYDGAIICDLPENFVDISRLRQVPDNQEVWVDKNGYTSIIFDIAERVGPSGSSVEIDGTALTTHLTDIVGDDIDTVKVWNSSPTHFSRLGEEFPAYTLMATQTPKADSAKSDNGTTDLTAIILTLLRLEKEATDIVITINVPHIRGEYDEDEIDFELGKAGALIGDAVSYSGQIWETFKIKDWSLFGGV